MQYILDEKEYREYKQFKEENTEDKKELDIQIQQFVRESTVKMEKRRLYPYDIETRFQFEITGDRLPDMFQVYIDKFH